MAIKPESVEGSYSCVGIGLHLALSGGPSQLVSALVPAEDSPEEAST